MIRFIRIKNKDYVSSIDFHNLLGLSDNHYSRNVKKWLFDTDYLFQGEMEILNPRKDEDFYEAPKEIPQNRFSPSMEETNKGGRPRQQFFISKELSKLIAINSNSEIKKRYVQWLLEQEAKIESYDYLTIEQVLYIIDLINCFKFITHQKAAEVYNKDEFIMAKTKRDGISIEFAAKIFNKYRTEALDIKTEDLKERLLRFFDADKKYKDPKTRRDMIYILDKFGLIKIAVFDFLSAANKPSEVALKVGELAKQMAERMDVEIRRKNEPDLFHPEIEPVNTTMLHRINPYIKEQKRLK